MAGELDPLSELRSLTEALRAHAEWQQACGSSALPAAVAESHQPSVVESHQPSVVSRQLREDSLPAAALPELEAPQRPEPSRERAPSPAAPPKLTADSSQLTAEERQHRLTVLAEEVKGCTKCGLHAERTQTVFSRGNGSSMLCFVGEGPGADEDAQGFPFVGAAGQLLDRMIAAMGIERDDVYVCNIVKCRPPKNRTPEPEEMSACMPYLTEQLSLIEPQVIVAMGETAVQGLFGTA